MDTYADDLSELIETLDLNSTTLWAVYAERPGRQVTNRSAGMGGSSPRPCARTVRT